MADTRRRGNLYLEAASEDDDTDRRGSSEDGYDSDAADLGSRKTKGASAYEVKGRAKRMKIDSGTREEDDSESESEEDASRAMNSAARYSLPNNSPQTAPANGPDVSTNSPPVRVPKNALSLGNTKSISKNKPGVKKPRPGIIYMPSLPPHLKPSALKNLLAQRGFAPTSRVFLTPSSKPHNSGKSSKSRKTYTEAWLELPSHKIAKRCVESLNANPIGGPKRGYYHDDLWNMRYLRGMTWDDVMGGPREERREEEVRKDDERRRVKQETELFLRGVEQAKVNKTMNERAKKREGLEISNDDYGEKVAVKDKTPVEATGSPFRWKQFKRKAQSSEKGSGDDDPAGDEIGSETKKVLGMIF